MALEKLRTVDTIWRPDNGTRAPLNVTNEPKSHLLEIFSEVELRDRFAVPSVGPKRLAGIRNQNPHDDRLIGRFCARWGRGFHYNFAGWFIVAQAFERRLTNHPVSRPAGEFYLRDELSVRPGDTRVSPRRSDAGKWGFCCLDHLEPGQKVRNFRRAVARANPADVNEMRSAVDADEQR